MGENAIYVSLWVSGAVPDPLNWRVARTGHAIDCVVFAVNIDDNSPPPLRSAGRLLLPSHTRCTSPEGLEREALTPRLG
jgi:hypothetical protein